MIFPTITLCSELSTLVFFVFLLCIFVYRRIPRTATTSLPLPPGPPAHWLFGNTMPTSYAHRQFELWTREYGPVFSLKRGNNILVVIGRHQAAVEIMEKENASLVDRPICISAGETLSGGMRLLLVRAGNQFRKLRRALHARLSVKASQNYEPIQMEHAKHLVLDILEDPANHQMHARRFAASVILSMTYGKSTPTSYNDYEFIQVNKCLTRLGQTLLPGAWLVDSYPILRYVPGYLNQLKRWHKDELQLFKGQLDIVRRQMATQQAPPSFAKYLLEHQPEFELSDDELAYLAGSMFGAGADTTAAIISSVVMAAGVHPEAQAKVQEELDLVVGSDRAPTFGDANILPQTHAFMLETYRWRPVSVGGVAHRATKDIIWRNYCIPAGASVLGNHWAIGHDPVVFPDPERFDPQRWLNEDGRIKSNLSSYGFGFGRRVCPGQHVADRSVFITTALTLWAFRISEVASSPIDVLAFTDTMNTHPLPFKVNFQARIKDAELRAIMETYGGA